MRSIPWAASVTSFKVPTSTEAAHDYLWRVHQRTPAKGEIAIFNRSHYEELLVVRVHDLVPKSVWSKRFDQINAWERMLTDEGTTILKFFLYIDAEEQRERLQDRIDNPAKRWKFKSADLGERKLWDQYIAAFEDVAVPLLHRTGRPGTSSRPTATGSGTSPWRRSSPTPSTT